MKREGATPEKLEAVSDIIMGLKGREDFTAVTGYVILAYTKPIQVIGTYDKRVSEFINVVWSEPPKNVDPLQLGLPKQLPNFSE